ncbi:hypothetical protein K474DRAFT_1663212 [Panus rudis PR-1116 ss-1]|nr:hypothetical protein K474DRAFT_1663212 [Panus rudis PR-1116 ss-1]
MGSEMTTMLITSRAEYILRVLQVKKIPFTSYDLASDEDAKKLWRRKAPAGEHGTSRHSVWVWVLRICR